MPLWIISLGVVGTVIYAFAVILLRERAREIVNDSLGRCQIRGCSNRTHYNVEKGATKLKVCMACGGELAAVHAWTVTGLARTW